MQWQEKILSLYRNVPYLDKRHIELRYRRWPFEYIEGFIPQRGLIIDIGCGHGLFANLMALKSGHREVIGIDVSSKKIDIANSTIDERDNIRFICSQFEDFDISSASAIVMLDVMYLIPFETQKIILQKINRTLIKGGIFLMQEILKCNTLRFKRACLQEIIMVKALRRTMGKGFYYRDLNEWQDLLRVMGFSVQEGHLLRKGLEGLFICQLQNQR